MQQGLGAVNYLLWGRGGLREGDSHLNFGEKLPETSPGIDLEALGQLQDELHDDGLVGDLLHQGVFLVGGRKGT